MEENNNAGVVSDSSMEGFDFKRIYGFATLKGLILVNSLDLCVFSSSKS